jgi:hypothetical protein
MRRALTIEVRGRLPGTEAQGGGTVKAQGAPGPGELTVQTGVCVSRVCVYARFQKEPLELLARKLSPTRRDVVWKT